MIHKFTAEEKEFMNKYVPGHSYAEIQKAFTEKFKWQIKMSQIKNFIARNKLNTGRNGQFQKGLTPPNKGKRQSDYMSVDAIERTKATRFKKGQTPRNHRMVGSERVTKDGYIEIKVEEPDKWMLKHRLVWQQANGEVPKGYVLIFKDGDKTNATLENLILVKRAVNLRLNRTGLCEHNGKLKGTAVKLAELIEGTNEAKRRLKENNGSRTHKERDCADDY